MPMDLANIELELDNVEERGAGRVPQEMAKSSYGSGSLNPNPHGMHPNLIKHKEEKTEYWVEAGRTQVLRKEAEI